MESIYFLLVIALCAAAIIAAVVHLERKRRSKTQARRKQTHQKTHFHPRHESGPYRHIHGHSSAEAGPRVEVWNSLHKRARDEERQGPPISATRVFSDEEINKDHLASELKMTAIEYTPEVLAKRSTPLKK